MSVISEPASVKWEKLFRNGPSKISLSRSYPFKFFKGWLPQILLGPFFNTLSQNDRNDIQDHDSILNKLNILV